MILGIKIWVLGMFIATSYIHRALQWAELGNTIYVKTLVNIYIHTHTHTDTQFRNHEFTWYFHFYFILIDLFLALVLPRLGSSPFCIFMSLEPWLPITSALWLICSILYYISDSSEIALSLREQRTYLLKGIQDLFAVLPYPTHWGHVVMYCIHKLE